MSKQARNSMAAVMTVLVTIVMWMTAIIGVVFLASVGAAIFAFHNGGSIDALNVSVTDGTESLPALVAGLIGGLVVIPAIIYVCIQTKLGLNLDLIAWASVAALFILSQVFREGTRLRDEEKMTI